MKNTLLISVILFLSNWTLGQSGNLIGTVSNNEGQVAPYVSVQLKEIKKGWLKKSLRAKS